LFNAPKEEAASYVTSNPKQSRRQLKRLGGAEQQGGGDQANQSNVSTTRIRCRVPSLGSHQDHHVAILSDAARHLNYGNGLRWGLPGDRRIGSHVLSVGASPYADDDAA